MEEICKYHQVMVILSPGTNTAGAGVIKEIEKIVSRFVIQISANKELIIDLKKQD